MKYTIKHGYRIPAITLGTVQMGLDYSVTSTGHLTLKQSMEILKYSLDAGISMLDTARTYGESEHILGKFFSSSGRHADIVTKFKVSKAALTSYKDFKKEAYTSVKSSILELGLERLPICLFHKDMETPMEQVMKLLPSVLEELEADDLIDLGGISVYYPHEAKFILESETVKAIQVPMNVFDQELINLGIFGEMEDRGKITFIRSVFLRGLFFMDPEKLPKGLVLAAPHLKRLNQLANEVGMTVAQLAFSYVMETPGVTSVVLGADNLGQVKQNMALLNTKGITPEIRDTIQKEFHQLPESIIRPGFWTV